MTSDVKIVTQFSSPKGTLLGLRQFLVTESPLKIMTNAFYFYLKSLFVLKIFKFLSWFFGQVEKWHDCKDHVNYRIYDVTTWKTNNGNVHIARHLKRSKGNQTLKFNQLIEYNMRNIFLEKSYTKCGRPRPFSQTLS